MEIIAYTVVAGYVILLGVCGYLRLRIEELRKMHFELRDRIAAHSVGLRMLYDEVCPIIDSEDDDEIPV